MKTDGATQPIPDVSTKRKLPFASRFSRRPTKGAVSTPAFSTVVVDKDDKLPTICGKLDAARLPDVAVDVSHGNGELSTAVGMRLLMRHADRAGKSVILVTRRQTVRQIAHAEGQSYVGSLGQVRFVPRSPVGGLLGALDLPLPEGSTVAWLIGLAALAVVALVFALGVLPAATFTLFPPSTSVSQEALFSLDTVANRVDPATAVVPATRRRVSVVSTILFPVTGSAPQEQTEGDPVAVPAVDSDDISRANSLAITVLTEQGLEDLNLRYGSAWRFFPQTAEVQVSAAEPAQAAGARVALLSVTYRGTVSMLGARDADIRSLLNMAISKQIEAGNQLIDSSVRLSVVKAGPFDRSADRLPLQMRLDASSTRALDTARIQRSVAGKSKREAAVIAEQATDAVRPPILELSPGWAPWLPRLGSRIKIQLAARRKPS
jgi:hypothetical protein